MRERFAALNGISGPTDSRREFVVIPARPMRFVPFAGAEVPVGYRIGWVPDPSVSRADARARGWCMKLYRAAAREINRMPF